MGGKGSNFSCLTFSDSVNIYDTPGLPSLSLGDLQEELQDGISEQQDDGVEGTQIDSNNNLAKFISKRVIWDDVVEYLRIGMNREGFTV